MILTLAAALFDIVMHSRTVHAQPAGIKVYIDQQPTSVLNQLTLRGNTVLGFSCTTASCYVLNQ
jgi:hypothetical protein